MLQPTTYLCRMREPTRLPKSTRFSSNPPTPPELRRKRQHTISYHRAQRLRHECSRKASSLSRSHSREVRGLASSITLSITRKGDVYSPSCPLRCEPVGKKTCGL